MSAELDAPTQLPAGMTHDEFFDLARRWLAEMGYTIVTSEGYREMTVLELRGLSGLSYSGLTRRLNHSMCPPWKAYRGETGRLVRIVASPALLEWVTQPKQPGTRRLKPSRQS